VGVAGGAALFTAPPWAGIMGGSLLFVSQVLDCADGMLARMRKSSSELGRQLDGFADGVTLTAACLGTTWGILRLHPTPAWLPVVLLVAALATVYFGIMQTVAYDHYKNVFLRLTRDGPPDEDLEQALARAAARRAAGNGLGERLTWCMYLGFLRRQRNLLGWFDPYTVVRLRDLPAYDAARGQVYRRHAIAPLRWLRGLFGVGSLVLGFAVFNAIGRPDGFLVYRLLLLNAIFFLLVWPLQRRASRRAFAELGLERFTIHGAASASLAARAGVPPGATELAAAGPTDGRGEGAEPLSAQAADQS
jgi:hypothetical protein